MFYTFYNSILTIIAAVTMMIKCASRWHEYYGRETDHVVVHQWPHVMILKKKEKNVLLIDVAAPGDVRAGEKGEEKVMQYQHLAC